jgi:hypothetical protein
LRASFLALLSPRRCSHSKVNSCCSSDTFIKKEKKKRAYVT